MSVIDTLVYDRTDADVSRRAYLKEQVQSGNATDDEAAEWLTGLKGSYNPAFDMNRVAEACAYIYDELMPFGYVIPGYTALRMDWSEKDIPTPEELDTYLNTIAALKNVLKTNVELPESMNHLTVDGANNIEKLLFVTDELIHRLVYALHRSAEFELYSDYVFIPTMNTDYGRTWEELDEMETSWSNWNAATWYMLLYGNMKAEV